MSKRKIIADEDFDKLVAEKQHEEFVSTMNKLIYALEELNNKKEDQTALKDLSNNLKKLSDSGIKIDMNELLGAIKDLTETKKEVISKPETDIEQWTFQVNRNSSGYIDTVTALKL